MNQSLRNKFVSLKSSHPSALSKELGLLIWWEMKKRKQFFFFFRRGFAWQRVRIICLNRQEGFIFVSFLVVLKFKDIINDGGIGLPENMCKEENDL